MDDILIQPIGVVRSRVADWKEMPRLGAGARVELFPEYADGLYRLEKHSHLWVMAWLDGARRDALQVTPRGVADRGPEGLHGVFAVRSPSRPNPIGLTLARIVGIDGAVVELDPLDFQDGTPVIDLKPYFVSRDLVFSATNIQIGRPADRDALRASLRMQALNLHGETCPDLNLAVELMAHFRHDVLELMEPAALRVTAPLARPHLVDALQGMTRATLGRGTLRLQDEDIVVLETPETVYEYQLLSDGFRASRRTTAR